MWNDDDGCDGSGGDFVNSHGRTATRRGKRVMTVAVAVAIVGDSAFGSAAAAALKRR
jgi:hypothetical protein